MDGGGGGGYVEAQPGPTIYDEFPEPQPLPWTEAAWLCLAVSVCAAMVATGHVLVVYRPLNPDAVLPFSRIPLSAVAFVLMLMGAPGVFFAVCELFTRCRTGLKVHAMTRRHVLPAVSRR